MDNCSKNKEIWKDVVGYEGLYQVSNRGRVRSVNREVPYRGAIKNIIGKELTIWYNNDGYARVTFSVKGKNKHYLVSRLVAEAFLPNPHQKEEVNHLDYNVRNNSVYNLEWCSKEQNYEYSRERIHKGILKAKCKAVVGTRLIDGKTIELESAKQGADYGFDPPAITNCLKGNYKQTKGYTWKYK